MNLINFSHYLTKIKSNFSKRPIPNISQESPTKIPNNIIYLHILLKRRLADYVDPAENKLFNQAINLFDIESISRENSKKSL